MWKDMQQMFHDVHELI